MFVLWQLRSVASDEIEVGRTTAGTLEPVTTAADPPIHQALGLTDAEVDDIGAILGREPNHLELAMYAVMWSEHCSYKSSRIHLKRLPTEGEGVLVGPGENAGVIDVGDGIAAAIRIESHNHPSLIEPYQGAATGVGGILRDIFTMGARPDRGHGPAALRAARRRPQPLGGRGRRVAASPATATRSACPPSAARSCSTPATRATRSSTCCASACCRSSGSCSAQATGVGQPGRAARLVAPGRDGIGGVSVLASAGFDEGERGQAARRVQVGDPFEEKRLIEACLTLLDAGLVVGIQDLGGAGLTCATSETASRGGVGMDVDVSRRAPPRGRHGAVRGDDQRVAGADARHRHARGPRRGAAALRALGGAGHRRRPGHRPVGRRLPDPRRLRRRGARRRPRRRASTTPPRCTTGPAPSRPTGPRGAADDPGAADGRRRCRAPCSTCSTTPSWVSSQYDHQLFLNTVEGPGGDAAVLRLKHPTTGVDTGRGLALTTDGNHRWCAVDPREGTALTVAESVLNLACVGARPIAVVNCLNFGNPEHPEVMWQLSEAIDGMGDACRALGLPVIGGNVSLYNETAGTDIDPTPVIGLLGMVDRLDRRPPGVAPGRRRPAAPARRRPHRRRAVARRLGVAWRNGDQGGTLPPLDLAAAHQGRRPGAHAGGRRRALAACTTLSTGGLGGALPRWRCAPASACRRRGVPSTAAPVQRGAVPGGGVRPRRVGRLGRSPGPPPPVSPVVELGSAGGDRLTISATDGSPLVDLDLATTDRRVARPPPARPRRGRHPGLTASSVLEVMVHVGVQDDLELVGEARLHVSWVTSASYSR